MRKPNFFILGAPKCGTTSMIKWLSGHPEIFITPIKEPHYYNKDHKNNTVIDYEHYISLFNNATSMHKIVGEASVWYLYSKEAVLNIKNDLKDNNIKFLVMIRNPVEMAYSLHQQQVFNLNEPIDNFKEAWHLEAERKKGKKLGLTTRNENQLLYGDICKLGKQLESLYKITDRKSVKVVLLESIKKDPEKEYKDVLSFLNLSFDGRNDFSPVNENKSRRFAFAATVVKILGIVKHKLRITKGFGVLNKVMALNSVTKKREKLDPEFENELKTYFKDDILLLSSLINKDLTHWLK